ncbi:MAG: cytochrome c biogenesis protein CcdC [Acidobacteriales bacterium]|nr:cytochrome c biogenesis protein CcdC [Terriglobales bacterium]
MNSIHGISAIGAIVGFVGVMTWRVREGRTAVTARKILIPPLGMATGFCMFVLPVFRVPWMWAVGAFVIGALVLAEPLIRTSKLTFDGQTVMMQRSAVFFLVVTVLAAVRFFARGFFDKVLTMQQTAGLFFVLAFGMILRWRVSMHLEYRRMTGKQNLLATEIEHGELEKKA